MYKRIIPCMDIRDGRTVKGIRFESLRDAGDPAELAKRYSDEGADELVLLDISATDEGRSAFLPIVRAVASNVAIPFTVGGGVSSVAAAYKLLRAGADKISVNSAAFGRPELIEELAREFGSQCVVVAVDVKRTVTGWEVYTHGGKRETGMCALEWISRAVELGAGELLVTSMDGDGTRNGFDTALYREISKRVNVPVIASGGAGTPEDFENLFRETMATGGLAASIFHFGEITIPGLKKQLHDAQVRVRITERLKQ